MRTASDARWSWYSNKMDRLLRTESESLRELHRLRTRFPRNWTRSYQFKVVVRKLDRARRKLTRLYDRFDRMERMKMS